jgi:hypothetical protein
MKRSMDDERQHVFVKGQIIRGVFAQACGYTYFWLHPMRIKLEKKIFTKLFDKSLCHEVDAAPGNTFLL